MDSVGEGKGGKIWENGIETCKISCMKRKKKMKKCVNIKQLVKFKHPVSTQPFETAAMDLRGKP